MDYVNTYSPSLHEIANNDDTDIKELKSLEGNDGSAFDNDEEEEPYELASTTASSTSAGENSEPILIYDAPTPTSTSNMKTATIPGTSLVTEPSVTHFIQSHIGPESSALNV